VPAIADCRFALQSLKSLEDALSISHRNARSFVVYEETCHAVKSLKSQNDLHGAQRRSQHAALGLGL
jgi:hypothetical protein